MAGKTWPLSKAHTQNSKAKRVSGCSYASILKLSLMEVNFFFLNTDLDEISDTFNRKNPDSYPNLKKTTEHVFNLSQIPDSIPPVYPVYRLGRFGELGFSSAND